MGSSLISMKEELSPWETATNYKCTSLLLTNTLFIIPLLVNTKVENNIHHQEEDYKSHVFPFYSMGYQDLLQRIHLPLQITMNITQILKHSLKYTFALIGTYFLNLKRKQEIKIISICLRLDMYYKHAHTYTFTYICIICRPRNISGDVL